MLADALPIKDFTDEEKVAAFDRIRESCLGYARAVVNREGDDRIDDHRQFIFEQAVEETLAPDIFPHLNRYR